MRIFETFGLENIHADDIEYLKSFSKSQHDSDYLMAVTTPVTINSDDNAISIV